MKIQNKIREDMNVMKTKIAKKSCNDKTKTNNKKGYILFAVMILLLCYLCACDSPKEEISGHAWQAGDGSILYLYEDQTYRWESPDEQGSAYYLGRYEVYMGKAAVGKVSQLEEGMSMEAQKVIIDALAEGDYSSYISLILHNEKCMADGINDIDEPYDTAYLGFYQKEGGELHLINMGTYNYAEFFRLT